MKYLYKILRIFFCPHKWELEAEHNIYNKIHGGRSGTIIQNRCRYCGKVHFDEVTV